MLKTITGHIKSDEVRHYSYFWRFFERYQQHEKIGRAKVLRAIVRRVAEVADDDGLIAFRHAFAVRYPQRRFERRYYDQFQRDLKRILRRHYPFDMGVEDAAQAARSAGHAAEPGPAAAAQGRRGC